MNYPKPNFTIDVDVTNPGQVLACCGLLELAHRRWSGVEAWFSDSQFMIAVADESDDSTLEHLFEIVVCCKLTGLSTKDRDERDTLERERRELKKQGEDLTAEKEERRKELGNQARAGPIHIEGPITMVLDWWQSDDERVPKTWAGLQEVHRIAQAAQDGISGSGELARLLDHGCVLREPQEYRKKESADSKKVEPFYFDARRFAHALDTGFSLDVQSSETIAHPAVELLTLIALQRFRPATATVNWSFDYWVWSRPMGLPVAAAVFSGNSPVPGRQAYRFQLQFRDDQKRFKAFDFASSFGGNS